MKPKFLNSIFAMVFHRREAVANSDAREAAIANAFSETEPMEENSDGWFKVSPYGTFRGKTPGRPQHFNEDAAKRMVSEFNSLRGKLGRMFRGVPIYIGHPDVDPTIWTDDRRLGKATDLQARPDGLWAFGEWNSLGRENQTEGFWVYPSPRWDAPVGQARFEPDRLISIGLTNTPRIETSEPLANSQLDTNTETPTLMDPKLIREKLGLAPETTDEEVFAKIESLTNAATDAETRAMDAENAKAAAEQVSAKQISDGQDAVALAMSEACKTLGETMKLMFSKWKEVHASLSANKKAKDELISSLEKLEHEQKTLRGIGANDLSCKQARLVDDLAEKIPQFKSEIIKIEDELARLACEADAIFLAGMENLEKAAACIGLGGTKIHKIEANDAAATVA